MKSVRTESELVSELDRNHCPITIGIGVRTESELPIGTSSDNLHSVGILTLGEISSFGDRYLEFFNKTIVSTVLYE